MINLRLIESQNISKKTAKEILKLQNRRDKLFLKMYYAEDSKLKGIYSEIVSNEYMLQSLWGFDLDSKFHNLHGCHVPKCDCPTEDNRERVGVMVERVVNKNCKVHGC